MNSTPPPPADSMEENNFCFNSDSNSDDDAPEYYQPISAVDEYEGEEDAEEEDSGHQVNSYEDNHALSNGYCARREAEDGISALGLNGDVEQKSESEDGEEEEEEERAAEAPESEIRRAFREDERRRRAPLTTENAARVMEAMRAVSFPGMTPDWASQDRWIDQLRRLRQPSGTSNAVQN